MDLDVQAGAAMHEDEIAFRRHVRSSVDLAHLVGRLVTDGSEQLPGSPDLVPYDQQIEIHATAQAGAAVKLGGEHGSLVGNGRDTVRPQQPHDLEQFAGAKERALRRRRRPSVAALLAGSHAPQAS